FDRVQQAENAGADQIVEVYPFRKSRPDPLSIILYERQEMLYQLVAQLDRRLCTVLLPELLHIHVKACRHGLLLAGWQAGLLSCPTQRNGSEKPFAVGAGIILGAALPLLMANPTRTPR